MAGARKARSVLNIIALYIIAPGASLLMFFIGWRVALENATIVLQSAVSPDGRYRAEVAREDPGASSSYEYMVRLAPATFSRYAMTLRIVPFGPVFVALDANHEPDKLTVQWTGPQDVTIHCQGCSGVDHGKDRWRDLRLKYELN
jgi:hypothetical protein